jgi:hypothetical protein
VTCLLRHSTSPGRDEEGSSIKAWQSQPSFRRRSPSAFFLQVPISRRSFRRLVSGRSWLGECLRLLDGGEPVSSLAQTSSNAYVLPNPGRPAIDSDSSFWHDKTSDKCRSSSSLTGGKHGLPYKYYLNNRWGFPPALVLAGSRSQLVNHNRIGRSHPGAVMRANKSPVVNNVAGHKKAPENRGFFNRAAVSYGCQKGDNTIPTT